MLFVLANLVYQDVSPVDKIWSRMPLLLYPHAKGIPTIMVETFIALERFSNITKVKTKMFIALDGPDEVGEGIIVLT